MSMAIEATGIGARYGSTWALRDCSLRLPAGHVGALVGRNGAGKTTLLNLIVGLLRPTEGTVSVFGWSPVDEPDLVLARVGYVGQESPLYRSFSVGDMLRLGRVMNRRWDQAAAEQRMRRRGISLTREIRSLSGGQRAQVALALALAKRPELLLLDEPLASLDPLARTEFLQELMESAASESLTVLLSSNLIGELERVCDYLLLLNQGRLQLSGQIEPLIRDHCVLVGPRLERELAIPGVAVVRHLQAERQSKLWVQGDPGALPSGWQRHPAPLEEIITAYMATPSTPPAAEPMLAAVTR
jgi:ABC-2 type transport system ATP-binding protein